MVSPRSKRGPFRWGAGIGRDAHGHLARVHAGRGRRLHRHRRAAHLQRPRPAGERRDRALARDDGGRAAPRSDQPPRPDAPRPHARRAALHRAGVVPGARALARAVPDRGAHRGHAADPGGDRRVLGHRQGRRSRAVPQRHAGDRASHPDDGGPGGVAPDAPARPGSGEVVRFPLVAESRARDTTATKDATASGPTRSPTAPNSARPPISAKKSTAPFSRSPSLMRNGFTTLSISPTTRRAQEARNNADHGRPIARTRPARGSATMVVPTEGMNDARKVSNPKKIGFGTCAMK